MKKYILLSMIFLLMLPVTYAVIDNVDCNAVKAWWGFNANETTLLDNVSNYGCTRQNLVNFTAGKVGEGALDFELSDAQYLNCSDEDAFSFGTDPYSISFWMKVESAGASNYILSKNTVANEWWIYNPASTGLKSFIFDAEIDSLGVSTVAETEAAIGIWTFIVITNDGGTGTKNQQVWFNLTNSTVADDDSGTFGGMINTASKLFIGTYGLVSNYYDGGIDELTFWNVKLVLENITALHNNFNGVSYNDVCAVAPTISAYNVVSAYENQTVWDANKNEVVYSRTSTPSINITLALTSNISCGIYDLNFTAMVANNSDTEASTSDTVDHVCTIPASEELIEGEQNIFIGVMNNENGTSFSGPLRISLDWNVTGFVLDESSGLPLQDVRVIVDLGAGTSTTNPGISNSSGITDANGEFVCYVPFNTDNVTARYEYTNNTPYNNSGLAYFELI